MKNIAIFASGSGSNAKKIMEHFEGHPKIRVALIVSNRSKAGVLEHAKTHEIPTLTIKKNEFYESEEILEIFNNYSVDFLVLAGFLWLIPSYLVQSYPHHILNIHPALLPKFGGKGMYGMNVHRAVKAANETESGMTIHWVNERYDEGGIVFQAKCPITEPDTPEDIARKVLSLEHQYYPKVIEQAITDL
ncbi:MAG: phosphoribosylglycinamide formyltransferase [Saprospiraceae bacterium]